MKISIKRNPNGDTRTAPKNITLEQFREANFSHKKDVYEVMKCLSKMLEMNGTKHDFTKICFEQEFYDNFLDTINNGKDFVSNTWYQEHIKYEKHHPLSYCHEDIDLLDIIEMAVDVVCAGLGRSGNVSDIKIDSEILQKALSNTITKLKNYMEVEE